MSRVKLTIDFKPRTFVVHKVTLAFEEGRILQIANSLKSIQQFRTEIINEDGKYFIRLSATVNGDAQTANTVVETILQKLGEVMV